jgi:hypothetical protein
MTHLLRSLGVVVKPGLRGAADIPDSQEEVAHVSAPPLVFHAFVEAGAIASAYFSTGLVEKPYPMRRPAAQPVLHSGRSSVATLVATCPDRGVSR